MKYVKFSIEAESQSRAKTEVKAGNFTFIIDEPKRMGGTDTGPNPIEYMLGALAGCINVTGHVVANEMGLKINSLKIHIEGNLNPLGFMGKKDDVRAGLQEINVKVSLDTDGDEETVEKWLNILEKRCPVSDNLFNQSPAKLSWSKIS